MPTRKQMDIASEQALLAQCRRQDFEAFGKIIDAYQSRVFGFAKRILRSEEEALDVTQEVFIKAFQSVAKFDGRSSLKTWLFRIAYNLCIDRTRKQDRTPDFASLEHTTDEGETMEISDYRWDPSTVLLNSELAEMVDQALQSMSEKLRIVLLLHDKEDLGYEEIASTVNVPVGTVKSRLFLARAHMQKAVGEYLATMERV